MSRMQKHERREFHPDQWDIWALDFPSRGEHPAALVAALPAIRTALPGVYLSAERWLEGPEVFD